MILQLNSSVNVVSSNFKSFILLLESTWKDFSENLRIEKNENVNKLGKGIGAIISNVLPTMQMRVGLRLNRLNQIVCYLIIFFYFILFRMMLTLVTNVQMWMQ